MSKHVDGLVHEMRNALAVARANVEAVIDGKMDASPGRLLSILQALTQLDSLIDDLKNTQPSVQALVRPSLINVCELLNREYDAFIAVAAAKNVKLAIHRCPAPLAACTEFYGDPVRIGQIVKNVMLNAVRYTPAGGEVSVCCSHPADHLEVRISDSGPGLSSNEADDIFEAGFRGSASSDTAGLGLGLSVVKDFVEAQGGAISASSTFPHGATFVVRLPGTDPISAR